MKYSDAIAIRIEELLKEKKLNTNSKVNKMWQNVKKFLDNYRL